MLLNFLNIFSKNPAYFGCLEFVYTNKSDGDDDDEDETDHLSSVSCVDYRSMKKTQI